jgi:hypothetical protein
MLRTRPLPLCLLLLGCGHVRPPAPEARAAAPSPAPATSAPSPDDQTRLLPPGATFADLVRAASLLDGRDSQESCLLARSDAGALRLAGDVRAGLRPLPQPALDLDEPLRAASHVQVLTPWGAYGSASGALAFASITAFPPLRGARVLALTDRGVSLHGTEASGTVQAALAPDARNLSALGSMEGVVVFVTAEAAVPVSRIFDLLEELGRLGARTSLAVNLAPDTALPAPAVSASPARCPDGLSETSTTEGSLSLDALLTAVEPLRDRAPECLSRGGAEGAAGGKLTLVFRIDERGLVNEACVRADELGDPAIAACVLELTRALRFPTPEPKGTVDAELPLILRPDSAPAPLPVCPSTES